MLLFLFTLLFVESYSFKTVTTSYGKLQGSTIYTKENVTTYSFKSVPFTKPPVGNLRFALPQKPDPWDGVLDATKYSAACLSNSSLTSTPQKFISENCLYLNIFTSEDCLQKKCSVIVYLHGGSFNLDSATMFPDKFISERYVESGIVFVIPAYRLGVFGQFYLGENGGVTINLLVHDVIAALNYVHDEVSNFGGNPEDVTLMGHSSGGQLVNALGFSHYVDPEQKLFQKFIVLSGHEVYGFEDYKTANSIEIAKRVNCFSENTQEIVKCMRKVNALDILRAQQIMEKEEHHIFKSLIRAPPLMDLNEKLADIKKKAPKQRKMLCGVTEHELEKYPYSDFRVQGTFLDFENPLEIMMTYDENFRNRTEYLLNTDSSSVLVSAATYSHALIDAGGEVYLFETRQKPYSMHVSDMQYFIGIQRENTHTTDMDILDSFYSKMLVNFTKYGEPSPMWEKLDPVKMNFLALEIDTALGIEPKMKNGFHKKLIDFWLTDMMELDKNITVQKLFLSKSNASTSGPLISESFSIYNQWWFYGVIVLIVIIVFIVILLILNKSRSGERQPLLS